MDIHESGISRNDINVKTLQENGSKVKISGNILLLVPSQSCDPPDLESVPSSVTWVWNGGYLKSASAVPGVDAVTQKVVEISTLGSLIELVNPSVVEVSSHLSVDKSTEVNASGLTWSLKQDPLDAAIDVIWNRLLGTKMPVSNITLVRANVSEHFPYRLDNGKLSYYGQFDLLIYCSSGMHGLVCELAMSQLSSSKAAASMIICPCCTDSTNDVRSHMGRHVLRAIQGVEEPLPSPVDYLFPCGFCGRSQLTHPECAIKLKVTSKGSEFLTLCPYQAQIKFVYTDKGSKKRPCRNIPVVCPLCPPPPRARETNWHDAVWRYNMEQHLNFHHPEHAHPGKEIGLPLPPDISAAALVDTHEEKALGVPGHEKFEHIVDNETEGALGGEKCKSSREVSAASGSGGKHVRMQ